MLTESRLYKNNANLQSYVKNTWLSCKVRWAQAFRKQQVTNIVNTNNGTEAQNKLFKYEYLPRSIDKSVYGIATMLVESFIPDSHTSYLEKNLKFSGAYRSFDLRVPTFLHNRPRQFVKHCLDSRYAAGEYTEDDVSSINFQKGVFNMKSAINSKKKHLVDFTVPSCSCVSWQSHYPCKHFFAVFARYSEWGFDSLPDQYRNSVFITLDTGHLVINRPDSSAQKASLPHGTSDVTASPCNNLGSGNSSGNESMDCECSEVQSEEKTHFQPPNCSSAAPVVSGAKLRKRFLDNIDIVKNTAYMVDDITAMSEAIKQLENIHLLLQKSCSSVNGIPLRTSLIKKKLKITSTKYHQVFHSKLPPRQHWKKKNPKTEVVVVEDSNDDVDDVESKKKVSCMLICT